MTPDRREADEIVENLHRNDLTPSERMTHQEKYSAILKKLKKVRSAHEKRIESSRRIVGQNCTVRRK